MVFVLNQSIETHVEGGVKGHFVRWIHELHSVLFPVALESILECGPHHVTSCPEILFVNSESQAQKPSFALLKLRQDAEYPIINRHRAFTSFHFLFPATDQARFG